MKVLSSFMIFNGMMSFFTQKKHTLNMLISIEMMMLVSIITMSTLSKFSNKTQTTMIMITFMVAEGATALAVITNFSKNKGNDLVSSLF